MLAKVLFVFHNIRWNNMCMLQICTYIYMRINITVGLWIRISATNPKSDFNSADKKSEMEMKTNSQPNGESSSEGVQSVGVYICPTSSSSSSQLIVPIWVNYVCTFTSQKPTKLLGYGLGRGGCNWGWGWAWGLTCVYPLLYLLPHFVLKWYIIYETCSSLYHPMCSQQN